MAGGSYTKRGDTWRGRVMIAGTSYSVTAPTKRECQLKVAELEIKHANDRVGDSAPVAAVVGEWWPRHQKRLAESTRIDYQRVIDNHVIPNLGDVPIGDLHQRDLNRLYDRLEADGLSTARVRRVHNVIGLVCRHAVKMDLIATSPAGKADPPSVKDTTIDPPSPDEIRRLLDVAASIRPGFGVFVRMSAMTGARRGELAALRISDVEFFEDEAVLTIARSISVATGDHGVGRNLIEKTTKTANVRRATIDPNTTAQLRQHLDMIRQRADSAETVVADDHFVFSDEPDSSLPWRPEIISRDFARCARNAAVECRLHDLRHFAATMLMAEGVDPVTGAARMGWARRDMFFNRYSHAQAAADRKAAEAMRHVIDD